MNFCLGLGLGQLKTEGSKWKLTSDLCFWLLQRKGKRGSGGSKWRPEAKANKNKQNAKATGEGEANVFLYSGSLTSLPRLIRFGLFGYKKRKEKIYIYFI